MELANPLLGACFSLHFFVYIVFLLVILEKIRATSGTGAFPPFQIFRKPEGFQGLKVLGLSSRNDLRDWELEVRHSTIWRCISSLFDHLRIRCSCGFG